MERHPCSWVGVINIVKTSPPPKAISIFNKSPTKISMAIFKEKFLKFVCNHNPKT